MIAARIILAVHTAVIAFNIFGLIAVPLGAARGWRFVRNIWFRLLHLASLTVVALQAAAGRACFLTIWQDRLSPIGGERAPLIMRWVNGLIYWPLPIWVFAAAYIAIWLYALALLWLVPLRR